MFKPKIKAYINGKDKNINLTGTYHISSSFEKIAKKFGNAEKKSILSVNIEKQKLICSTIFFDFSGSFVRKASTHSCFLCISVRMPAKQENTNVIWINALSLFKTVVNLVMQNRASGNKIKRPERTATREDIAFFKKIFVCSIYFYFLFLARRA